MLSAKADLAWHQVAQLRADVAELLSAPEGRVRLLWKSSVLEDTEVVSQLHSTSMQRIDSTCHVARFPLILHLLRNGEFDGFQEQVVETPGTLRCSTCTPARLAVIALPALCCPDIHDKAC